MCEFQLSFFYVKDFFVEIFIVSGCFSAPVSLFCRLFIALVCGGVGGGGVKGPLRISVVFYLQLQ